MLVNSEGWGPPPPSQGERESKTRGRQWRKEEEPEARDHTV